MTVSREDVLAATRDIVQTAAVEGTLSHLTPKSIRQQIAERHGEDEAVLRAYKTEMKEVINETIAESKRERIDPDPYGANAPSTSNSKDNRGPAKHKRRHSNEQVGVDDLTLRGQKSDRDPVTENEMVVDEEIPTRKAKRARRRKTSVESDEGSESEGDAKKKQNVNAVRTSRKNQITKTAAPSGKKPTAKAVSTWEKRKEDHAADKDEAHGTKAEESKADSSRAPIPLHRHSSTSSPGPSKLADATDEKSESEMSVLIDDDPPPKKKKGKAVDAASRPKKATQGGRGQAKETNKDDETIKRLKALVVACGVRKQWAKEFAALDRPSAQIKRIKEILASLGMTGRMSMEQAKAIRAKRELQQEIEDVVEFERKHVGKGTAKSHPKTRAASGDEGQSSSDSDEPEMKRRPTRNARQSISAFLGDDSD